MRARPSLLRPRDADALRAELRHVAGDGRSPVTFGGEVHGEALRLTEFVGTRTASMHGLAVRPSAGLGGATMVAGRPMSVVDYSSAATITHDYDAPVVAEGIRSILAVPVVVEGTPRAVLYGAYRTAAPIGDRTADLMIGAARRLSHELRIRDEVDRRLRMRDAQVANVAGARAEEVREVHAQLRRLAADPSAPPALRAQLRVLAERLARGGSSPEVALSPRELDVLAQIALGCTNVEAAQRLSLKPETVKGYLRSATAKLGARTRHEAVSKARLARLLP